MNMSLSNTGLNESFLTTSGKYSRTPILEKYRNLNSSVRNLVDHLNQKPGEKNADKLEKTEEFYIDVLEKILQEFDQYAIFSNSNEIFAENCLNDSLRHQLRENLMNRSSSVNNSEIDTYRKKCFIYFESREKNMKKDKDNYENSVGYVEYWLAFLYSNGWGVEENITKAFTYARRSAKKKKILMVKIYLAIFMKIMICLIYLQMKSMIQ